MNVRKAKIVEVTKEEYAALLTKMPRLGIPTLYEMGDPTKTVYDLIWLRRIGQNYKIKR